MSEENRFHMNSDRSRRNFHDMLEVLGTFRSGLESGDPKQYQVENFLGFIGKYLFGEPLLIDLGYYKADVYYSHGQDKNYWEGTWTGKRGIDSKSKLLNSPDIQELIIREAFALNWRCISDTIKAKGQSIYDYLGLEKTYKDRGELKTIAITLSGILGSAYLRGPYGVADLLLKNRVFYDEFEVSILQYADEYGGYETIIDDFLVA